MDALVIPIPSKPSSVGAVICQVREPRWSISERIYHYTARLSLVQYVIT
jgi:hypothetical protein